MSVFDELKGGAYVPDVPHRDVLRGLDQYYGTATRANLRRASCLDEADMNTELADNERRTLIEAREILVNKETQESRVWSRVFAKWPCIRESLI